jgi:hypothetical protein
LRGLKEQRVLTLDEGGHRNCGKDKNQSHTASVVVKIGILTSLKSITR